jgi:hypothetical protein
MAGVVCAEMKNCSLDDWGRLWCWPLFWPVAEAATPWKVSAVRPWAARYSIKYVRHAGLAAPAEVRSEVEKILAEVDRELSTYRGDSDIERFNACPP